MELMKVQAYAELFNVSVQSVYQKIAKGNLDVEIKDNIKYIKVYDKPINKPIATVAVPNCKELLKPYKQMIKALKKDIERIEADKDKQYAQLEKLFDTMLKLSGRASLPAPTEAEVYPVKKSKKKRKKKK